MNTGNIKLYDIFRKDLRLREDRAHELVQTIGDVVKDHTTRNHDHTAEIVNKDIQALKEHMDIKFSTKEEVFRLEVKMEGNKSELIRWMFLFWIGQIAATLGFILVFLKGKG
jgi:hypothetical protein